MKLINKTVKQLKVTLWNELSKYIRTLSPKCDICKKNYSHFVHHVIKRSRGNSIFFEPNNLVSVCHSCHFCIHYKWDHLENKEWIDRIVGEDVYLELKHESKQIKKFTRTELIHKINFYRNVVKELNNEI